MGIDTWPHLVNIFIRQRAFALEEEKAAHLSADPMMINGSRPPSGGVSIIFGIFSFGSLPLGRKTNFYLVNI